jgi:hypothetical protein
MASFEMLCGFERMKREAILSTLWNSIDYRAWCHDPIWGDMWIWTDDVWCSLHQIYKAMYIGKTVTSSHHDHFEVIYLL